MANYTTDPLAVTFTGTEYTPPSEAVSDLLAFAITECSDGGSGPTPTYHYHKRAWRNESGAFVEWDTTTPTGAYPGGGTLDPPLGAILYQWTT